MTQFSLLVPQHASLSEPSSRGVHENRGLDDQWSPKSEQNMYLSIDKRTESRYKSIIFDQLR